jgi:hypothetical protein
MKYFISLIEIPYSMNLMYLDDSRNPYASGSSRDSRRQASRSRVDSRSKVPGSPWVPRIVVAPRRRGSGSNLALGILLYRIWVPRNIHKLLKSNY